MFSTISKRIGDINFKDNSTSLNIFSSNYCPESEFDHSKIYLWAYMHV